MKHPRNFLWWAAIKLRDLSEKADDLGDRVDKIGHNDPNDYRCHLCGRWNSVCPH